MALAGCYKANFREPTQRLVRDTAVTLPARTWNPEIAIAGTAPTDVGANIGVGYGITDKSQLNLNLAHAVFGLFNLQFRQNFVDRERWALLGSVSMYWMRMRWLWVLDSGTRQAMAHLQGVSLPVGLTGTVHLTRWLDASLEARYAYADFFGRFDSNRIFGDGAIGLRVFDVHPTLRFYLWGRAALTLNAGLPLWARAPVGVTAGAEIEPGVEVVAQSVQWLKVPLSTLWVFRAELAFVVTEHFRVAVGAVSSTVSRNLLTWPVMPALRLSWRIGGQRSEAPSH